VDFIGVTMSIQQNIEKNCRGESILHSNLLCPQCGKPGHSVAAINNKESEYIEKKGVFSGAGIGLTASGLGLGVGGGTYRENGTQSTKRAKLFEEPCLPDLLESNVHLNPLTRLCALIIITLGFTYLTTNSSLFHSNSDFNSSLQSLKNILNLSCYLLIFLLPICFISFLFDAFRDNSDEEFEINKKNEQRQAEHKKKLTLYHEMRYCEHCHLLYNNVRDCFKPAHRNGFENMLKSAIQ
jgi:hypothetical protein